MSIFGGENTVVKGRQRRYLHFYCARGEARTHTLISTVFKKKIVYDSLFTSSSRDRTNIVCLLKTHPLFLALPLLKHIDAVPGT